MLDINDVDSWTAYLRTKPAGTTPKEAEGVLGRSVTDGRKISGLVSWGLMQREGDKVTLTAEGRSYAMGSSHVKTRLLSAIVLNHSPYLGTLEWAAHNNIETMTSADVVARWLDYYRGEVGSDNETSLNRMAVCFFYLLQGAGIGNLIIGRRGLPTRFDVDLESAKELVHKHGLLPELVRGDLEEVEESIFVANKRNEQGDTLEEPRLIVPLEEEDLGGDLLDEIEYVFVGHGKNQQILDQVKELLTYGRYIPVVAEEEETTAVPVPRKVLAAMRRSQAGVINVSADEQITDGDGKVRFTINQNVLTEIGAAFVLYDEKVVLLTDRRVELPSNLQGIYRCEYQGDSLDFEATMRLLKALNRFRE